MKHTPIGIGAAVLWLATAVLPASAQVDVGECHPKIDDFVVFVDQSGSMYMHHDDLGEVKMALTKTILAKMDQMIEPYGAYKVAVDLFAPFEEVVTPETYYHGSIMSGMKRVPDDQPFDRMTPMGSGFEDLGPVLARFEGRKAVIMFSDGKNNGMVDPVGAATGLLSANPNTCIHVVSLADCSEGNELNRRISQLGGECQFAEAGTLLRDDAALAQFVRNVFCGPAPVKRRIVLRGVNFDFDKSNIRADARPVLDEAIRVLKEESDVRVSVEGHTDAIGTDAYNQGLSERRARSVADYLIAGGIASGRISTAGFGEGQPVASNATDDGRAQNRRVELRILGQ